MWDFQLSSAGFSSVCVVSSSRAPTGIVGQGPPGLSAPNLTLNLLIPHFFFFSRSQVQNVKKSGKHEIEIRIVQGHERGSENSKKGLSMENKDKKAGPDFATSGSLGVFLRKSTNKT